MPPRRRAMAPAQKDAATKNRGRLSSAPAERKGAISPVDIRNSVLAAIGNTPLIRLKRASDETGCEILGKAEFMNPGQSVKDRAGLFIIQDAIARGQLRPGGTVVEGTAGNTGIGLAVVGNAMGFRSVIVIPETQSQEKKDALREIGRAHV